MTVTTVKAPLRLRSCCDVYDCDALAVTAAIVSDATGAYATEMGCEAHPPLVRAFTADTRVATVLLP